MMVLVPPDASNLTVLTLSLTNSQILVKKGYRVSKRASKRRWKLKHLDMEVADDVAEVKGAADKKAWVSPADFRWSTACYACGKTNRIL